MSYTSTKIASTIEKLNRSYYLPAIQRPYVWEPEQIITLFDSLLKGYPISSFLFWELKPENFENWDIYKFKENFKSGQVDNELLSATGGDVTLVLDGQQRLTSLLIGLKGSYTIKLKNKRWDNPDAWVKQKLYIDLLKDPRIDDSDGENIGVSYGFKFLDDRLASQSNGKLFRVGKILEFDDERAYVEYYENYLDQLPGETTNAQRRIARQNFIDLYQAIWKNDVISYYTERNQSYDRVLDIFIRANNGGIKLSKSDLLLSMITSKWDGIKAREEIYNYVERINNDLASKNDIDKDLIMRACLLLSDLNHVYKIENFTNANLAKIQNNWDEIKRSFEGTIKLINRFGIDRDTLTSSNALLPIAYYIHNAKKGGMDGSTSFELNNAKLIRKWLIGALLNNVFGGSSDNTIGVSREIIKNSLQTSSDFPYLALVDGLAKKRGRVSNFDENNINALFDIRYSNKTAFLALSLLYDNIDWGSTAYHIDHIIPKSLAGKNRLANLDLPESQKELIISSVDRIGNLQLLLGRENLEKNNKPFDEWVATRDPEFLKKHLIPTDKSIWKIEQLPAFVEEREKLMREYLSKDY